MRTHLVNTFPALIFTLTTRRISHYQRKYILVVWDTKTGVVIGGIDTQNCGEVMFHGDQRTITVIPKNRDFYTYDALNCTELCQGEIPSPWGSKLGAHWAHNDTLQFITSYRTNEKLMINIYELQPTSIPPLHVVSSFHMLPYCGEFSFSPASFHASFFDKRKVVVFDVRDSKLLLQTKVTKRYYPPPGQFSPDGHFFVCRTSEQEIHVWQNRPGGYVLWNSLRPRLLFEELLWSPTSISILCWGSGGIQLLHPGNSPTFPSPKVKHSCLQKHYLVAYSADGTHVATAWRDSSIVTVFDCLSGTQQQFTNAHMQILDIKITYNTVFAVGAACELVSWDIKADGTAHSAQSAKRVTVFKTDTTLHSPEHITLSHNCSQIAYIQSQFVNTQPQIPSPPWVNWTYFSTVFLHNTKTWERASKHTGYKIVDIKFSLDGNQLWFTTTDGCYYFFEIAEGWESVRETIGGLEDGKSLFNHSSHHGYNFTESSAWVVDSTGKKSLWLPPNWRRTCKSHVRWEGNCLILLHDHYPEPIVIKFQP